MPTDPHRPFAFLVHPRTSVRDDLRRRWRALARVPEAALERALRHLPLPPLHWGTVHVRDADRPLGHLLLVPASGRQMLADRRWAVTRVTQAVDRAAGMGAGIVGLGALTSPVTRGGEVLRDRADVGLTTGNAFTAAMIAAEVRRAVAGGRPSPTVAVVGASGSVGTCAAELVATDGRAGRLLLLARRMSGLEAVATRLRRSVAGIDVRATSDMQELRDADVVVLLTAATGAILRPEHLRPGAVVVDGTQPRNTAPQLCRQRPDVRVVDGGLVSVPGLRISADIDLPPGCVYACLAETMLLTLDGHRGHFGLGTATVDQARHMTALARRHGFALAPPHAFGHPLGNGVADGREAVSA